ncbi:MAG: AAA family ATPase, partial [Bacillota bacterium]|nr:AAA family ATPase [Bacillota bacterium]
MKIRKIEIGSFGKFANYKINFNDGINIVYGNNEDGKSTIMAFIKMMFYGAAGKSLDLSKNIRRKYAPWNGDKMSGFIEFEHNGVDYRVEKIFGASNLSDKVNLWNMATGEKEKISSGTDIGQRFFGIGSAAFEKSVFIGQIGSTISSDGDKDDEITQKLLNLVSTGDEKVSQKKVIERLETAKNVLKAKSGKTGTLVNLNKTLENLNIELFEALGDEKKKSEMQQQYEETVLEEEKLKNDYEINKLQYNIQEKLEEIQKLEYSISKKKYLDSLVDEYNSKKQKLVHDDIYLDSNYVKNCEDQLSTIQTLEKIYEDYAKKLEFIEIENEQLKSEKLTEVTEDYLKSVKIKDKEKIELQNSIDELQNIMKETNEFNFEMNKEQ